MSQTLLGVDVNILLNNSWQLLACQNHSDYRCLSQLERPEVMLATSTDILRMR